MEKVPEIFGQESTLHEYEKRIQEIELLVGHKEVEIGVLKKFLAGGSPAKRRSS